MPASRWRPGSQVYFCDPKSPWQRGSNENTNGLLRQYLPRTVNMRDYTQADFDAVAEELTTALTNTQVRDTIRTISAAVAMIA